VSYIEVPVPQLHSCFFVVHISLSGTRAPGAIAKGKRYVYLTESK